MENAIEQWKDIPNFEGLYQISNIGNVKGLERTKVTHSNGKLTTIKEKALKPYKGGKLKNNNIGYLRVCLSKDNKKTICVVHVTVAKLFVINPDDKPCVNHEDTNKHNNAATNLTWCTHSENMEHYYKHR